MSKLNDALRRAVFGDGGRTEFTKEETAELNRIFAEGNAESIEQIRKQHQMDIAGYHQAMQIVLD